MDLEFDPVKNAFNLDKHGLSFTQAQKLDWAAAVTKRDNRTDYGEDRYTTYAPLGDRVCVLIWTPRQEKIRPISFRKANARERKRYEKDTKN